MSLTLDTPLRTVLGDKTARALDSQLGLRTVGMLLRHYPRRYAERGHLTTLTDLRVGEHVTVFARVRRVSARQVKRGLHKLDVVISDGTRELLLTYFNQPWRAKDLGVGREAFFAGQVTEFRSRRQLRNPEYELVDDELGQRTSEFAGSLVPIYPATVKLSTFVIRRSVHLVLDQLDDLPDPLPEDLRMRHALGDFTTALRDIHRPTDWVVRDSARHRLAFDEALVLQVALAQRRWAAGANPATPRARRPGGLLDAFDAALPFTLTDGQREVGEVIAADLARDHPMNRLLQGEVGSGKTVVAVRAMLQAVDAGAQAALLAPTEVLAAQHASSVRALLGPLATAGELGAADPSTRVALLTGSQSSAARRAALAEVADGSAGLVVGTHALLQEHVAFADLGLVVVDEQHRFGVEQRDALRAKAGDPPHVLVMTATPIPRTVAMTVFGDLEVSSLSELPRGRSAISTSVVPVADRPGWLDRAWARVREEVEAGQQAFVVCPRIGGAQGSEDDVSAADGSALDDAAVAGDAGAADGSHDVDGGSDPDGGSAGESGATRRPPLAVLDVLPMLAEGPLAGLRVEALHGRLPTEDKEAVMRRFAGGESDVLVATTVVEVGVDVPRATVMVVMDAERFGVSQLHQLRGRVGRGSAAGLCLLVTDAPEGTPARERLDAVASTNDGFVLADLDLEQRREGDVLGAAQSGRRSTLRLLSLRRDVELIEAARAEAADLVAGDPALGRNPALARAVVELVDEQRAAYLEKA